MLAICTFLLFTGLVAVASWWLTRHDELHTATGYFLAGRSLTWIVVGGSLLMTNISTEQLVGLNGGSFKDGMEIVAWELGAALAMVVMTLVCLPLYLRGGITTIPEFLEHRYDKPTRGLVSLMILLSVSLSVLPFVLYSGALFMRDVFEIPQRLGIDENAALWLMVVSIGTVGSIYAIFGGLRAVAISDTLNAAGLLIAGIMLPLLGLSALGGGDLWAGCLRLQANHRELLNPVGEPTSSLPVGTLFTGVALLHLYYWCTNQFIVQRTFASRSLQQGQKGVLFAAFLKLLGPFYLVLPGVIAFHLYADQIDADGNLAYSTLVRNLLPAPLLGFFAAAIFGAILSTFNSALNSCATLFSVDLYKGFLHRDATDHQLVRVGKIFGTCLAVLVILGAPAIEGRGSLFDTMKRVAATFDIPLMAIVFVGILSRRTPASAAWMAILMGVAFYVTVALGFHNTLGGFELHWLHVAGINFALMMLVMAAIRWAAPRPAPYEVRNTGQVDVRPWALAGPLSLLIVLGVGLIYGGLWWAAR